MSKWINSIYTFGSHVLVFSTCSLFSNEWVSVEEKLPEPLVFVLVTDASTALCPISIATQLAGQWMIFCGDNSCNSIILDSFGWELNSDQITHWMSLPKPPREIDSDVELQKLLEHVD